MPWQHCTHLEISDDRNCPTCGLSKQEWTVKVQVTRVLRLGGQPTVKIELKDDAGAYQAGVKYRIELPDGMIALGELNPAGYAKASSKIPGDAVVSFPDLGAGVTAVTDRARPGDEAGAWQRFATEKQTDAERALAAVRSRTGIERAMLRVAERTLADAHATVRARLGRLDRELLPNASPAAPTQHTAESAENAKPRARARHKRRSA